MPVKVADRGAAGLGVIGQALRDQPIGDTGQTQRGRALAADYLNLDRSALSKELGKMQKEGILEFHKNKFTLRHPSL